MSKLLSPGNPGICEACGIRIDEPCQAGLLIRHEVVHRGQHLINEMVMRCRACQAAIESGETTYILDS